MLPADRFTSFLAWYVFWGFMALESRRFGRDIGRLEAAAFELHNLRLGRHPTLIAGANLLENKFFVVLVVARGSPGPRECVHLISQVTGWSAQAMCT